MLHIINTNILYANSYKFLDNGKDTTASLFFSLHWQDIFNLLILPHIPSVFLIFIFTLVFSLFLVMAVKLMVLTLDCLQILYIFTPLTQGWIVLFFKFPCEKDSLILNLNLFYIFLKIYLYI